MLAEKVLWAIERNLDRSLTLAELADACGVSHFHLAHALGQATGFSVMQYVRARQRPSRWLAATRPTFSASRLIRATGRMRPSRAPCALSSAQPRKRSARPKCGESRHGQ